MAISDYYSQYIEIVHMPSTTARATVEKFKNICARWGIPERVTSDNGPQFSADDFNRFEELYGIELTLSSPGFPQSNGQAENGVQVAKHILRNPDPSLALMIYHTTPISATGLSPSELMIGRAIRTTLPMLPWQLQPKTSDKQAVEERDLLTIQKYTRDYNRRYGVKEISSLQTGDPVRIKMDNQKTWSKSGIMVDLHSSPRSFLVDTRNGRIEDILPTCHGRQCLSLRCHHQIQHLSRHPNKKLLGPTRSLRSSHLSRCCSGVKDSRSYLRIIKALTCIS